MLFVTTCQYLIVGADRIGQGIAILVSISIRSQGLGPRGATCEGEGRTDNERIEGRTGLLSLDLVHMFGTVRYTAVRASTIHSYMPWI